MTTVRYFAAAEDAAGRSEEKRAEQTLGALRAALASDHPELEPLLPRCAVLVDGRRTDDAAQLIEEATVIDILPPFAGG